MPPSKRSGKSKAAPSLTPAQKTSFDTFFTTVDYSLWSSQNIKAFFRKFNYSINDKLLTSHAIRLTKQQLAQHEKDGPPEEAEGNGDEYKMKERALRDMLDGLQRKRKHLSSDFQTPPKRGIRGPKHSPIAAPVLNVYAGSSTNNISLNSGSFNIIEDGGGGGGPLQAPEPTGPASPGEDSCSDTSKPDTFSAHFRNMHHKLRLGNKRYLEDLVYDALRKEIIEGGKELWLLESSIVNFDHLTWLDPPTRTELKKFQPKSPKTLQAIIECEAYLNEFWESTNFEQDMPPLLSRTPWGNADDYGVYNYYHLFVHYWYNFIPTIAVDPSRGSEAWLAARLYNNLFSIFKSPLVSLRHGETASIHLPSYRFDGIFSWNNIEFGAIEIAPEGAKSSNQAKVEKDCFKLYQVVGKIYNRLNVLAGERVPYPAVGIMCRGFSFTIIKVSHLSENLLQTSHHEYLLPTTIADIKQLKMVLYSIGILYNMINENRKFVNDKLKVNNSL